MHDELLVLGDDITCSGFYLFMTASGCFFLLLFLLATEELATLLANTKTTKSTRGFKQIRLVPAFLPAAIFSNQLQTADIMKEPPEVHSRCEKKTNNDKNF